MTESKKESMETLRETMKKSGIPFWKYAQVMGVCEMTLYRWLRIYDKNHYEKISNAIDTLSSEVKCNE